MVGCGRDFLAALGLDSQKKLGRGALDKGSDRSWFELQRLRVQRENLEFFRVLGRIEPIIQRNNAGGFLENRFDKGTDWQTLPVRSQNLLKIGRASCRERVYVLV